MSCPTPLMEQEIITLAHGSGGKEMSHLIEKMFLPIFQNEQIPHDGTLLHIPKKDIVFTTDSFVVQPLFFPGGNIGTLAVTGTLNDLAMCGGTPLYLSCSFIIEEGFPKKELHTIVLSMQEEAQKNGVSIVTGDTKVVERTTGNNLFINTSGIGVLIEHPIHPGRIESNDVILLSGDVGRHGMAIMAARHNLSFTEPLTSDCMSLVPVVQELIKNTSIHCLRDATRGGVATVLVELAESAKKHITIDEARIAVSTPVRSAAELLGLDPLFIANEGRFVAIVPEEDAGTALSILKRFPGGEQATIIGRVGETTTHPRVVLNTAFGSSRYITKLAGEQLPRIC